MYILDSTESGKCVKQTEIGFGIRDSEHRRGDRGIIVVCLFVFFARSEKTNLASCRSSRYLVLNLVNGRIIFPIELFHGDL